jgi:holliday junction DNA helicase RuvB
MTRSFVESSLCKEDEEFEMPLRPQSLRDFVGQQKVCERLEVVIKAALQRGDALGHSIFCGPPGLGKTTLATIISKVMGTNLVVTSGPVIEKAGDLAGLLTGLQQGDVLFIDEIHRLNKNIEEYLYTAMEDFALDLMIDSGPSARSVRVTLNKFTLVGATTRMGLLAGPLRSRFTNTFRLDYYQPEALCDIIVRSSRILAVDIDNTAAYEIARRSRGTPRIANNLLRWVRDFVQVRHKGVMITPDIVVQALNMLSIDDQGLDEMDKKILNVIIDYYNGGPVGVKTIAVAVAEDSSTIEEVYEPYLILQGFLQRTAKGRKATALAYRHLGKALPVRESVTP